MSAAFTAVSLEQVTMPGSVSICWMNSMKEEAQSLQEHTPGGLQPAWEAEGGLPKEMAFPLTLK